MENLNQTHLVYCFSASPTFIIEISIFVCPSEVKTMTRYLGFSLQILFHGQVSAGEARCTVFLNSRPHLCVFYGAAMIDCNIFYFFSPPLSNHCLQSGGMCFLNNQEHLELKCCLAEVCQRFFPSLCCGYFKNLCKLGYKSD